MHDLIVAGGGLAGCLTAYRLSQRQPQLDVLVLENAPTLGGNHTWSFFPTDLSQDQLDWIEPLIAHRWPSYEVRFPDRHRFLTTGYCSTNSSRFHEFMSTALGERVKMNARVTHLNSTEVRLETGEILTGGCVIDARGPQASEHLMLGFQKFTGLRLKLHEPHGLTGPIIMDANVPQLGDFRFVYTLPLSETEVMVEDTRYSTRPDLDTDTDLGEIRSYVSSQGWQLAEVISEEQGVLPITLGGDIDAYWDDATYLPRIGLRGVLFHATTGYSLADAVRTADLIAGSPVTNTRSMHDNLAAHSKRRWHSQAYHRLLNRMLFIAARPEQKRGVMARFYGLRQPLIERFYAGRSTALDRIRILTGKPPVDILPALRCLSQSSAKQSTEATS